MITGYVVVRCSEFERFVLIIAAKLLRMEGFLRMTGATLQHIVLLVYVFPLWGAFSESGQEQNISVGFHAISYTLTTIGRALARGLRVGTRSGGLTQSAPVCETLCPPCFSRPIVDLLIVRVEPTLSSTTVSYAPPRA